MELKNQILLGVGIGLGCSLISAVYTIVYSKKMEKELDDLAFDANEHLVEAEADQRVQDWIKQQESIMKAVNDIYFKKN